MRKITPEDLFGFHLVGHVAVHPHRHQVVYQEQQANREQNTTDSWLMVVEPGASPRRFTGGTTDTSPAFSPDGAWVAFLSKRSGTRQIWLMPTDGGEARQVTHIKGGVEEFRWLPDSQTLLYIALIGPDGIEAEDAPEDDAPYVKFNRGVKVITEQYHKLDGVGYYTKKRPHLVVQAIAEGSVPRQLTHGPMRHASLSVSPDGRWALTASRYGEDYDRNGSRKLLYLIDLSGAEAPRALSRDPLSTSGGIFAPDGHTIYFLASNHDDLGYDNVGLYRTDLDGREARRIAAQWDRPFSDVSISDMPAPGSNPLRFDADGQHLFILTSRNGTTELARVGLEDNHVELVTTADQVFYSYDVSHDRKFAALATSTPLNPGQIVWLDLKAKKTATVLANPNQELLNQLELAEPRRFTAHAPNGPAVDGWVMKPVGLKPGEKAPTALEIHGGPMMMYAQAFFFEFQWLAANGYGVVYSNPRGSQGYGRDFCIAIQPEWGNLDFQDVMAALDTAINEETWIDTDRLGVLGGSYGGYMTNWIVGHTDRFKAAITMRSVVDWKTMIGTGDLGWHWIQRADNVWPWSGNDEWYRQQSPITYVENITTPLLIEHQEGDLRCPIEQGEMLYTAMKYFNKAPVKFIRYPDEFHGMSRNGKPWHRIFRLNTFTEWFDQYLK
ncbi:alpha/beta hydrolase family protein [Sulfobacillus harzensis]|uniref:S9 family peptidase n=1 Tax=Sulfobacillus harzensis TaxID=2729629 RepID=A0A7Y0Q3F2_9FIRM|nr:S9 family peptidase [Sulfobacillus harzensis]NMP22129.1 S9 family peptidase [Sulfobacillus harzensis]